MKLAKIIQFPKSREEVLDYLMKHDEYAQDFTEELVEYFANVLTVEESYYVDHHTYVFAEEYFSRLGVYRKSA